MSTHKQYFTHWYEQYQKRKNIKNQPTISKKQPLKHTETDKQTNLVNERAAKSGKTKDKSFTWVTLATLSLSQKKKKFRQREKRLKFSYQKQRSQERAKIHCSQTNPRIFLERESEREREGTTKSDIFGSKQNRGDI